MIYLDTHVVAWLYEGFVDKLSPTAKKLLEENDIFVSPMVYLELEYLHEIKRIKCSAKKIIDELTKNLGLNICDEKFFRVILIANDFAWTRDPFDRIIVANAAANDALLITKDASLLENYKKAVWD